MPGRPLTSPLWSTLAVGALAPVLLAASPRAGWEPGPVEVLRVFRPGVIEIGRDGERVPLRLVGVDAADRANPALLREALAEVEGWLAEGSVHLVAPRGPERGELVGQLRLFDGTLLNERLLAEGHGLLDPRGLEPDLATLWRQAQLSARARGAGLWGGGRVPVDRVVGLRGRLATVCGNAGSVMHDRDGSWLVHLGPPYPRHEFTARIPADRVAAFERPDERWLRHDLCVTGRIRSGLTVPETDVLEPSQLQDRGGLRAR